MYTDFGGHGLSGFGDTSTLKNGQIFLSDHGLYSPWPSKNLIDRNWLKTFMQVGLDVTCMYTGFGGHSLSSFGDNITSQKRPNFPFGPWTNISPWSSKNLIHQNWLKKYIQVDLDVTYMYADFGRHSLSSFGDNVTSQKRPNFPFGRWTI